MQSKLEKKQRRNILVSLYVNKNMNQHIIGVDAGVKGALALLSPNKQLLAVEPIPTMEVLVGKKIRNQYDIKGVCDIIKGWQSDYQIAKAGFERLRAIPNQSSQTAFSMGGSTMMFKTIFTIYGIPFVEIEPRSWQKEVFSKLGVQYNSKTTKQASIQAAKQLFPGVDFKRTERCLTDSPDMCDASNIAYYVSNL